MDQTKIQELLSGIERYTLELVMERSADTRCAGCIEAMAADFAQGMAEEALSYFLDDVMDEQIDDFVQFSDDAAKAHEDAAKDGAK